MAQLPKSPQSPLVRRSSAGAGSALRPVLPFELDDAFDEVALDDTIEDFAHAPTNNTGAAVDEVEAFFGE